MTKPPQGWLDAVEQGRLRARYGDDEWRAFLRRWGGADTAGELDRDGCERVIDRLVAAGWHDLARPPVVSSDYATQIAKWATRLGMSEPEYRALRVACGDWTVPDCDGRAFQRLCTPTRTERSCRPVARPRGSWKGARMADLDVSLKLRLLNGLSGPAAAAKKDLAALKAEVLALNGVRGGEKLTNDLKRTASEAGGTARSVEKVKQAARGLEATRGPDGLATDLKRAAREGAGAARETERVKQAARGLEAMRGPDNLANSLKQVARAASVAAQETEHIKALARASGSGGLWPDKLADALERMRRQGHGAARETERVKQAARGLEAVPGPDRLAAGLRRVKAEAAGAAGALDRMKRTAHGAAASSAALEAAKGKATAGDGGTTLLATGKRALMAACGYYAVRTAMRATVGEAVSFEKATAEVKKKVDGANDPAVYERVEGMINRMARTYGIARGEMAALTAEAGATGIATQDLERFMRLAAKAAVGWDMEPREAAQKFAEIKAGMQLTIPQTEELGDKINALGDNSAAKERDIVEMFQRAGAAAETAKVKADATLAVITGARAAGMPTDVVARWFSQLAGGLAAETKPKRVEEGLKLLGLTAKQVADGMQKDSLATILDLFGRLDRAQGKLKIQAATKIFGQEWWDETARAGKALPEIIKNLGLLADRAKWQRSLDNGLNIQLATTANHLERTKALVSEIGDRLSRWTLPPINAGLQELLSSFQGIDRYLARRKAAEGAAGKRARGEDLTPEETEAYHADPKGVDARGRDRGRGGEAARPRGAGGRSPSEAARGCQGRAGAARGRQAGRHHGGQALPLPGEPIQRRRGRAAAPG